MTPSAYQEWFMAAIGRPGQTGGGTTQGFYMFGADGTVYNRGNFRGAAPMQRFLNRGLVRFWADPPDPVDIGEMAGRWSGRLSEDTTVVRVFSRVRPVPENVSGRNRQIGRDHMWLFADEVREIVSAEGDSFPLPKRTALKIVRFHMVDNVRGEPDRWFLDEINKLEFKVTRLSKGSYSIHGEFDCATKDGRRGMVGTFDAAFTVDLETMKCTKFRAFAEAEAWGDHRNTSGAPDGRFRVVFGMLDVDDAVSKDVPPQQSYFWAEYLDPFKDDMGF